jgi:hypothetical protein
VQIEIGIFYDSHPVRYFKAERCIIFTFSFKYLICINLQVKKGNFSIKITDFVRDELFLFRIMMQAVKISHTKKRFFFSDIPVSKLNSEEEMREYFHSVK